MIKQLFFTAALLVPGLAYAANPSANLSVQVIPAGPPAPPAQATVANFNTCVVCIDFTAPSGGVWVNGAQPAGVNAAQPNTWLDCAGAGNPIWFAHGFPPSTPPGLPCPNVQADGQGNPRTLRVLLQQQTTLQNLLNGMILYDSATGRGIMVPTNAYMEEVYIIPQWPSGTFGEGVWFGGAGEIPGAVHNAIETDPMEQNPGTDYGNPGGYSSNFGSWIDGGGHCCGSNWFGVLPPHWNGSWNQTTQYFTIGHRFTSDGTTAYNCMWINGVFQNCISATVDGVHLTSDQLGDTRSRMQTYFHPVGTWGSAGSGILAGDAVSYTQHIYIWSCPDWQTTACKTSNPNPGGY